MTKVKTQRFDIMSPLIGEMSEGQRGLMINWAEKLSGYGRSKKIEKETVLFHVGEEARAFFLVTSGSIRLYKLNPSGKETILRKVKPGEILGEVMVFTDSDYPVGAIADEDSELIEYSKKEINKAISDDSNLSMFFIKVLSQRCLMLNDKIYQFSLQDVPARLAGFLIQYINEHEFAERAKSREAFELSVSKKELANSIATIPETLSRTFQKLHKMGIVKVFGKTIIVQDYDKLKELAEAE